MQHEWVILTNLKQPEESRVPAVQPKLLPGDWKAAFMRLTVLGWQPAPERGDPPRAVPAALQPADAPRR